LWGFWDSGDLWDIWEGVAAGFADGRDYFGGYPLAEGFGFGLATAEIEVVEAFFVVEEGEVGGGRWDRGDCWDCWDRGDIGDGVSAGLADGGKDCVENPGFEFFGAG